jgi:hypothetical protein
MKLQIPRRGQVPVFSALVCHPRLLSVQQRNCVLYVPICRPIRAGLSVVPYQILKLATTLHSHTLRLSQFQWLATQNCSRSIALTNDRIQNHINRMCSHQTVAGPVDRR